jgi:hypothetical protein
VAADSGIVADDELVVFMFLHGYLLRRAGADLNLPPNENKAVLAHFGNHAWGNDRLHGERIVPLRVVHRDAWAGRQLQHGRALTFAQMRQQDDFSVGELKGIMMNVWPALVDLLELRHRVPEAPRENNASIASHLFLERKLGARE